MDEMRSRRLPSLGWLVAVVAVLAGCAAGVGGGRPSGAVAAGAPGACILVDTDAAVDDFRAVTVLLRSTRVVGIVATEGIALPARGAMAMAHLVAASPSPAVTVLVGMQSAAPSNESWLPEARANAERLNGFLAEAVPLPEGSRALEDEVERITKDCGEVRAVVIGPWSSFVRYRARLGGKLRLVVTQGLPLEDVPQGRSPGFNCRYDLTACRQAHEALRPARLGVWVDVPRNATPPYAPTAEMIAALAPAGLPGTLRALLLGNPEGWKDTLMWDDSAALYVLHPEVFERKGAHVEPKVSPDEIRRLWLGAANRSN